MPFRITSYRKDVTAVLSNNSYIISDSSVLRNLKLVMADHQIGNFQLKETIVFNAFSHNQLSERCYRRFKQQ